MNRTAAEIHHRLQQRKSTLTSFWQNNDGYYFASSFAAGVGPLTSSEQPEKEPRGSQTAQASAMLRRGPFPEGPGGQSEQHAGADEQEPGVGCDEGRAADDGVGKAEPTAGGPRHRGREQVLRNL